MPDSVHAHPPPAPETVNRIAAGEVVERPASAVKELVENALDAGARRIEVTVENGGLTRILVADDGHGLSRDELPLAVERHATSKLQPDPDGGWDLLNITTRGFRGEALPSIGSVSRLAIASRARGQAEAWAVRVEAGDLHGPAPAGFPQAHGARIEVRDLFYATPARLKFMKSARAEALAISDEVRRQAMARPDAGFTLEIDGRRTFRLPAEAGEGGRLSRLAAVLGREFEDNALCIDQERDGVRLHGFAGLPTYNRGQAGHQHLFVNGRPVRDRVLQGALRAAYADVLARDRHPVAALYLELDPVLVDVNVHPAKTEVRFRDPALVRGLIVGALRHALAAAGHRASSTVAGATLGSFRAEPAPPPAWAQPWTSALAHALPGLSEPTARYEPVSAREPLPSHPAPSAEVIDPLDFPWGRPAPRCMRPTSWPRPATAW